MRFLGTERSRTYRLSSLPRWRIFPGIVGEAEREVLPQVLEPRDGDPDLGDDKEVHHEDGIRLATGNLTAAPKIA